MILIKIIFFIFNTYILIIITVKFVFIKTYV